MEDVVEEYRSSLLDLNCNSKPLINMLTMLAEDNVKKAPEIVQVLETHLRKVSPDVKLPVMYLIDNIIKNLGETYLELFTQNIVSNFCSVFEKVDEKTRMQLLKLRQTWSEIFPPTEMYALDVHVQAIDPAWQIMKFPQTAIHVNPNFLEEKQQPAVPFPAPQQLFPTPVMQERAHDNDDVRQQLIDKQQELIIPKRQKMELDKLNAREQELQSQPLGKDPHLLRKDPQDSRTSGTSRPTIPPVARENVNINDELIGEPPSKKPKTQKVDRRPSSLEWNDDLPPDEQDLFILSQEQEILREASQRLQAGLISPHEHQMVLARFEDIRSRFQQ